MLDCFLTTASHPVPLHAVTAIEAEAWSEMLEPRLRAWVKVSRFKGEANRLLLLPGAEGDLAGAVLGLGADIDPFALARFSAELPQGDYAIAIRPDSHPPTRVALAWALGTYAFKRYKNGGKAKQHPRLVLPEGADGEAASTAARAIELARDLINTPASDMGPAELEAAARQVAMESGARCKAIAGERLLQENYPMIYAVGKGSIRAPRLIDIVWGDVDHPRVTLVGKGVCFDSGGLDLKTSAGMLLMKKDMGGAASMLALAKMVMEARLPVRLRVLIPAVENSVSGASYRPGDILASRKGLTVEVGNTDAEGRLVLADALAEADTEEPALLINMATLTGAARTATGFELPPFFTDDEDLAGDLMRLSVAEADPMWRLPLWKSYDGWVDGKFAQLTNSSEGGTAGAITAALFLKRFVTSTPAFVHFDIAAWVDRAKPGRPVGGEAQGIRALFALIKERFGAKTS